MRIQSTVIDSIAYVSPPSVWSSEYIEQKLGPLYERLRLPEGRLELMTGIRERRFWDHAIRPSEASAEAGKEALKRSGIPTEEIEVCIHCSVSRDMLEPASASFAHRLIGLSPETQVFDVSNACLGFLNSLTILSAMIDAGQVRSGLVVSGENGRPLLERTIQLLLDGDFNRKTIKPYFANLTIGAGAVAAVVCHESMSPKGHRLCGGAYLADTSNNDLCQGDSNAEGLGYEMQTDSEQMLHAGVNLAKRTWESFKSELSWANDSVDRVVCHQVGSAHQKLIFETLCLDTARDYSTFAEYGNTGSAALPLTLAKAAEEGFIEKGHRVGLLGIGSGLNCLMLGVEW